MLQGLWDSTSQENISLQKYHKLIHPKLDKAHELPHVFSHLFFNLTRPIFLHLLNLELQIRSTHISLTTTRSWRKGNESYCGVKILNLKNPISSLTPSEMLRVANKT